MTTRKWSATNDNGAPLGANDQIMLLNTTIGDPADRIRRLSKTDLDATILSTVEKTNEATGWTLSGGTTSKTLTLTEDSTIDQDLQTTADVLHGSISVSNSTGDFGTFTTSLPSGRLIYESTDVDGVLSTYYKTPVYNTSGSTRNDSFFEIGLVASVSSLPTDRIFVGRTGLNTTDFAVYRDGSVGIGLGASTAPSGNFSVSSAGSTQIFMESTGAAPVLTTMFKTTRYDQVGGTNANTILDWGFFENSAPNQADDRFYFGQSGLSSQFLCIFPQNGGKVTVNEDMAQVEQFHVAGDARTTLTHYFGQEINLGEITTPATPTNSGQLYYKADGNLYTQNKAGTETNLTGGATDSKWEVIAGFTDTLEPKQSLSPSITKLRLYDTGHAQYLQIEKTNGNTIFTSTSGEFQMNRSVEYSTITQPASPSNGVQLYSKTGNRLYAQNPDAEYQLLGYRRVIVTASSYAVQRGDDIIVIDTTSNNVNIVINAGVIQERQVLIIYEMGGNTASFQADTGQTINGLNTQITIATTNSTATVTTIRETGSAMVINGVTIG